MILFIIYFNNSMTIKILIIDIRFRIINKYMIKINIIQNIYYLIYYNIKSYIPRKIYI